MFCEVDYNSLHGDLRLRLIYVKKNKGTQKMTQKLKVPTTKLGNMILILGIHTVEGENYLLQFII